MTNKHVTFEDWMKEQHMKASDDQGLTDDDYPDAFDGWVSELDAEEVFQYAEKFGEDLQFAHAVEIGNLKGSLTK